MRLILIINMGSNSTEGRSQAIKGIQDNHIYLEIRDKKDVAHNEEGPIVQLTKASYDERRN